jgi:hypothetical protein
MNRKQRACVAAGFFLLVVSLLFVPTHPYRSPLVRYSFLFTGQGSINFARLFAEWLLIGLVTGGLFYLLRGPDSPKRETRPLASERNWRRLFWLSIALYVLIAALGITSYGLLRKVRRLEAGIRNIKTVYLELQQPDPKVGADALRGILDPVPVDRTVKADAWDAYYKAKTPEEFRSYFDTAPLPNQVKHALWDLKFAPPTRSVEELQVLLDRIKRELDSTQTE